ncbi:MAG: hypothetical protein KC656_05875 [Myxococcales bacterium]|nr:hypothetical protein [Myxococcales bacterium]MCB9669221.1 hypothetical protein [Alphaproteobacteria bacterium]
MVLLGLALPGLIVAFFVLVGNLAAFELGGPTARIAALLWGATALVAWAWMMDLTLNDTDSTAAVVIPFLPVPALLGATFLLPLHAVVAWVGVRLVWGPPADPVAEG